MAELIRSRRRDFWVIFDHKSVLITKIKFNYAENEFIFDPELQTMDMSYLSHKEKYEEAIRRATLVLQKIKKLQSEGLGGKDLY